MKKIFFVVLGMLLISLMLIGCTEPAPQEKCEQTGIEGVHVGGNNFCKQKGFDYCTSANLIMEMKAQEDIWIPIGCDTPHSQELWEQNLEKLGGEEFVEDGFYIFDCCSKS